MSEHARALAEFIRSLPALDLGRLLALAAAGRSGDEGQRSQAWSAVKRAVELHDLADELDRLRSDLLTWAGSGRMWRGDETAVRVEEFRLSDARLEALPALLDAAAALLLAERIDRKTRRVLLAPWESVTAERPPNLGRRTRRNARGPRHPGSDARAPRPL